MIEEIVFTIADPIGTFGDFWERFGAETACSPKRPRKKRSNRSKLDLLVFFRRG
jgi:hypothetical protein